ncbi:MAG: ATPase, T2SS/T4P/T4SS family, partial [Acidimicrobiales bacterium]
MTAPPATARAEWSRRLGRALATAGYVDEESLVALVDEALASDMPLGALAIARGVAPASVVVGTLSQLSRLPAVDLTSDRPAPELVALLAPHVAREHRAVVLRLVGSQLVVVFAEPPEPVVVRSLGELVGHQVMPALGDPGVIDALLGIEAPAAVPAANGASANGAGSAAPAAPVGSLGAVAAEGGHLVSGEELPLHLDDLLRYAVEVGASDLHLTANMPPTVRLHGALRPLDGVPPLDPNTVREMIFGVLPQGLREKFEAEHELDTSHSVNGVGRFRVNVCLQRGTIAVALRPIPHEIPEFAGLGLPETVASFAEMRRGLVLVTGPTGSGKSTSLASIVDIINRTKPLHIVTVED